MEVLAKPNQLLILLFRSQLSQDIRPGAAQTPWAGTFVICEKVIHSRAVEQRYEGKGFGSHILGARPDEDDWFIQKRKNDQTS